MSADKHRIVYLARTRGFCAGVRRAIETVDACLTLYGAPVYVLHAIVHNRQVVEAFESKGVVFVEDISTVPIDRPLVFSAHGVPKVVEKEAAGMGIARVIDATCPLVKRVHHQAVAHHEAGAALVLLGHRDHPEIIGTLGQIESDHVYVIRSAAEVAALPDCLDGRRIICLAQTTLTQKAVEAIVQALRARFQASELVRGATVCYASENRQAAVRLLAEKSQKVLIVGSPNSSNANRLRETAISAGTEAHLVESAADVNAAWLQDADSIGVSAGASTPEASVNGVLGELQRLGWNTVVEVGAEEETIEFNLPAKLSDDMPDE